MNKHMQNILRYAVSAPVASGNATRSEDRLPAWDGRTWLVAVPLALFVITAFIPTLDNGFVNWDDEGNFLDNRSYRGLGAAQVRWAWTTFRLGAYQPLAWLLFEAQYAFSKLDPRGYHLTSLVLHAANAVVLYVLTVTLLVRCRTDSCKKSPWTCAWGAGLATALFAVHPLRVEAVAWASCQPYLPCALFFMLAVLAYLRAFPMDSSPRGGWLVGSFVLFIAALCSKAVAVSLPAVLLILDVYPLRRFGDGPGRWFGSAARRVWLEKVPFVMVSLLFMGLAIAAKPQSRFPIHRYDAFTGIAQACYGIWFYIQKTVLPLDLSAYYPSPRQIRWLAPPFLLSILGTLGMSAGLFMLRRRWPGLLVAWLCYLVILAPNSGIIWISDQIAADRYSYIAMLGWVILAAACLCRLGQTSWRARPGAIGIVAVCLGAILVRMTWSQCRTWRDSETLWTHALSHGSGNSCVAHNNLGLVLYGQGKIEAATAHYTLALRLNPAHANAHNNLGAVLSRREKYEAACAHYAEALRLDPGHVNAHNNLGLELFRQGNYEEAAARLAEALRLDPGYANAHINLGGVLFRQGKLKEAATHYAQALRLSPNDAEAHNNLGLVLSRQGKYEEAAAQYGEALRLDPGHANAHNNLGLELFRQGKYEEAAARLAEALRLDPGHARAHNNLGSVLYSQGKLKEAATHYALALRLNPGYAEAHNNLGLVLSRQGKYEAAAAQYREALRLNPGDGDAYNNHAMIMAACPQAKYRDGKRAVESATRACELTEWKQSNFLNTLAAAYAEAGDFDAAVTWQKRAIEFLMDEGKKYDYRSRLVLYQARMPYRDASPPLVPTEVRP